MVAPPRIQGLRVPSGFEVGIRRKEPKRNLPARVSARGPSKNFGSGRHSALGAKGPVALARHRPPPGALGTIDKPLRFALVSALNRDPVYERDAGCPPALAQMKQP